MKEVWQHSVGVSPFTVRVFEHAARGHRLYLKWWDKHARNWRQRALKRTVRTEGGRLIKHVAEWAKGEAKRQHEALLRGVPAEERPVRQLTIGDTAALLIHPDRGKLPKDTPHRREVLRELALASQIWGPDRTWNSIGRADFRELRRKRMRMLAEGGHTGFRGTEITIARVLSVAEWLRDEEHIDDHAALPEKKWKDELKKELDTPEPKRPRYTPDEMRRLIAGAPRVDPRFGLLVSLGAELRLGQVSRCPRSALDLEKGELLVRGSGKKKGAIVVLTPGQLAAAKAALTDGYLRHLESLGRDYPLFPAGQMTGGRTKDGAGAVAKASQADGLPIDRRTAVRWWHQLEELLEIPHLEGRGAYGVRRTAVDEVMKAGISKDGLKEHGGWADTQMPDRVYRDQERRVAREEASAKRAEIRGET